MRGCHGGEEGAYLGVVSHFEGLDLKSAVMRKRRVEENATLVNAGMVRTKRGGVGGRRGRGGKRNMQCRYLGK